MSHFSFLILKAVKNVKIRVSIVCGVLLLCGAGVLRGLEPPQAKPAAKANAAQKGDSVKGRDIFTAQRCALCHKIDGSGGVLGPDLSAVGTRKNSAWLREYLPNPQAGNPANKMPPVAVKGQDLEDLIAYLLSLKGKTLGVTSPVVPDR